MKVIEPEKPKGAETKPFRIIMQFDANTTSWDEAESLGEQIGKAVGKLPVKWMIQEVYLNVPYEEQ